MNRCRTSEIFPGLREIAAEAPDGAAGAAGTARIARTVQITGPKKNPRLSPDRRFMIDALRRALLPMADPDCSICEVASRRGIFCKGFGRWCNTEFDRRCRPAIGRSTHLTRDQMEKFADIWQLAEQIRQGISLACDLIPGPDSPCRGWEEFSDRELERLSRALPDPGSPSGGTDAFASLSAGAGPTTIALTIPLSNRIAQT